MCDTLLLPVLLAEAALPSITLAKGDLWLLAGFVLLGWVFARMTIHRRRRTADQNRETQQSQRSLASEHVSGLPLSDAPVETQRWQVALFELQRELKGELDSRVAVVQSLLRQADEKIAKLESLQRQDD